MIATDIQGRILYWNRFAEQLYGWPAAAVVGRHILDVTPAGVSQAQAAELMSALQRGEHWSGEFWVQHRDGRRFLAEVSDSLIVDGHGQVVGIEIVPEKVERLRQGISPIYEPGIEEVLQRNLRAGRLSFTTDYAEGSRVTATMVRY